MTLADQKAPMVGIARPGRKPLALSRATLSGLLTGRTSQITLTDQLEICAEGRHYHLRSLDMRRGSLHYKTLKAWAASQRKKKASRHLSREERQKAELLRQIAVAKHKARCMTIHYRPYNPALEYGEPAGDYEREQWAAWSTQKPLRREIGRLAVAHGLTYGYAEAGVRDPRRLYQALAVLTGQEVRKYGELRTTRRSQKPAEGEYLKHLYDYAGNGLESKPYCHEEWRTAKHIRRERLRYRQQMRDWRNARENVNRLRARLASFENIDTT
jgi:hypothetical protein